MADFLTNLAMRLARPHDTVRPRLPSMFEPAHLDLFEPGRSEAIGEDTERSDRAIAGESGESDADPARGHGEERQTARNDDQAGANPTAHANKRIARASPVEDASLQTGAKPHRTDDVMPPKFSGEVGSEGAAPRGAANHSNTVTQRNSQPAEPGVENRVDPRPGMRRSFRLNEDVAYSSLRAPRNDPEDTPERAQLIVGQRIVRPAGDPESRPHPTFTPDNVFGVDDAHAGIESGGPAERASEPVIHVSIGRVEVRAVSAPQRSSAKGQVPSPVMSLEDYLRTRAR